MFCAVIIVGGLASFLMQLTLNKAYLSEKAGPIMLYIFATAIVIQVLLDTILGYRFGLFLWLSIALLLLYQVLCFCLDLLLKQKKSQLPPATDCKGIQVDKFNDLE